MTVDFRQLADVACETLGGSVLHATDDFFAEKERLIEASAPEWREHDYTPRGKWMDGWESRRKRAIGEHVHDEVVVRLAMPVVVRGIIVDTSFFRGNFPEGCEIDGCCARADASVEELLSIRTEWLPLVGRSPLAGNANNEFSVTAEVVVTHVRLRIFPDGGVARLRVHGEVAPDWRRLGGARNELDLAALENGGQVLACSDMFFGPKHNLIAPGRAINMGAGWETKRRRGVTHETHDWAVVALAAEGVIDRVEVDTNHFKGNFPDTCSLEVASSAEGPWRSLLARTKLMAHTRHLYVEELHDHGPCTHVRMNVFPDGGISRLRVFGRLIERAQQDAVARQLRGLSEHALFEQLRACCASKDWVFAIARSRPFSSGSELFAKVDAAWAALPNDGWLEAFAAHPRIGERKGGHSRETRWSAAEQAGVTHAGAETLAALAEANALYEQKFGYVFLICATGKTAADMLHAARARMLHTPDAELRVASAELLQIMHLRLRKLVGAQP